MVGQKSNAERFEAAYTEAMSEEGAYFDEAYKDYRFFVGDQWTTEEKTYLKKFNRETVVFNYIKRFVKRVGGHQRAGRLATNIEATENQDEYIAEIYDDVSKWIHTRSKIYRTISDAFEKGALVPGINLLHSYVDYSNDPINGTIKVARRGYNTFLLAPDFVSLDLSDCRYIITRDYMTRDDIKRMLPKRTSMINDLKGGGFDNKFEFSGTSHLNNEDILAYDEFWERIAVKRYMLMDNLSGETRKWKGNKKDLNEHIEKYPWVQYFAYFEPTVQQTIFVQGEELYHKIDPYGSSERDIEFGEYPYTLISGYIEPDIDSYQWKVQGVVRGLRDAQREENKRKSQMFSILDSSPSGGYIVKNGSVINSDELYQSGPGVVITIDEAAQMTDVQELRAREVPQSTMMLSQQLKQDLVELGGGSEEFMGTADLGNSQISGTLAKMRASNSAESLQDLLDNLNFAQENLGSKIVKLAKINFTKEHIERITGKKIPENFFDEDVEKFDLTAAEGMLTDSNRNLAYIQGLQAKNAGINIPDKFIIANMPIANKSELMQQYDEEQQQAQEQQRKLIEQDEINKRLINAETVHKLSLAEQQRKRSVADEALAMERVSESKLNQARVIDTRIDAILKQIQIGKEIQGMDLERLQSAIKFILELYENKRLEEEAQTRDSRQQIETDEQQALYELNLTDEMRAKVEQTQEV